MYKKYAIISLVILILSIIARVYLQSEHVKTAYTHQKITEKLAQQEKRKLHLMALLHEVESSTAIRKDFINRSHFVPLSLQQVYSLSAPEIVQ